VTTEGLTIIGSIAPGFPVSESGYGARAYGNTQPGLPSARWLLVRPDGTVTAFAGKVEYGQNIRTGFAVEVADELRVPLEQVGVVLGDTESTPWDMGTFGSQSTARVGLQLRKAAATAREALLELAASRLDVFAQDLLVSNGRIASKADPSVVSYGELVAGEMIEREINDDVPLTQSGDFQAVGSPVLRMDAEARVTGRAIYSQDVLLPGMLFARILRPTAFGQQLADADTSVAERMPGVAAVAKEGELIAVAEDDESADRAFATVEATWTGERTGTHLDIPQLLIDTKRDPVSVQAAGDVEEGLRTAEHVLEGTYYVPHVAHIAMEPRAAVARWEGEKLTVWAGTQRPFGLRSELATHFRVPETNVRVIALEIGGAFGTKSWYPAGLEAARLARFAGRPVRVAYSRQEDTRTPSDRGADRDKGDGRRKDHRGVHIPHRPFRSSRAGSRRRGIDNVASCLLCRNLVRVGSYRSRGRSTISPASAHRQLRAYSPDPSSSG
jgi:isoquinoline 1-oxidoreductase